MSTRHCYILNMYALSLMVSEKKIFKVFPFINYKSVETFDSMGGASLDHRGRIHVGGH